MRLAKFVGFEIALNKISLSWLFFYHHNDINRLFRSLTTLNVFCVLYFCIGLKAFHNPGPNVLTLLSNNTSSLPSLINIFHITNAFYDKILKILLSFRSWEDQEGMCTEKRVKLYEWEFPAYLLPPKVDHTSLIIHSWFIFKLKKHLLLLFKSLQTKEKLIHWAAWVTPLMKISIPVRSPFGSSTIFERDNGGKVWAQQSRH